MIGNEFWFNEYIKFIDEHKIIDDVDYYCEKHHIYIQENYIPI